MVDSRNKIMLVLISIILIINIIITNNKYTSYYIKKDSNVYYFTDKNNDIVPVPVGFEVSKELNIVTDGLVIIDLENKNEFVWVPCDNFERINYYYSSLAYKNYNMKFVDEKEYKDIYDSVKKYKGFYIGRYEASRSDKYIDSVLVAASIANTKPWNQISYSTNMNDIYGYSSGALKSAKYTYKNYDNVNSTITYPEHYDSIIKWFLSFDKLENENGDEISKNDLILDGNSIGNSNDKIIYTGSNSKYCIKHICDLMGNVYELTPESYYGNYHIMRGSKSLSYKKNIDAYSIGYKIGFRLVLII